jgi:LacI family transcriptional regulator
VPKDLLLSLLRTESFQNILTITTVSQSGIKMGNRAAQMLIDRLREHGERRGGENYQTEVIETHLIERSPLMML